MRTARITEDGCILTDTMIEIVEGNLERSRLELALAHASRCSTCRAVLSSLARTAKR